MLKPTPLSRTRTTTCPFFGRELILDDRALPRPGELERIGDQVLKNLLDQSGITLGSGKVCNLPAHDPVFDLRLQQRNDFFDDRIQARRLEVQRVPADSRQIQQLIHQQAHAVDALFDALQVSSCFGVHSGGEVFNQDSGKTADVAERRAQIMRNGIGEGLQFVIGCRQLRCAFFHPLFKFLVELADLALVGFSLRDVAERHHATPQGAIRAF